MKLLFKLKKRRIFFGAALVLLLYIPGFTGVLSSNIMRYLLQIFLYIALGEAWNLLSGYAGMTSLGQQLYVGLAGYSVAVMTSLYNRPLFSGIMLSAVTALAAGFVLSFILFRMEGMYFAIGTWVAAEAMEKAFLNWKFINQGSGMTVRLTPYPSISRIYLLALTVCLISIILVCAVLRSKLGLGLMAMRDDPRAAASSGVNLRRSRLIVYELAALISALAGSIFFLNKGTVYPDSGFSVGWTISCVFICITGGTGTVAGPVAGAVLYVLQREILAHFPGWSNILMGALTLIIIFFFPGGIVGTLKEHSNRAGVERDAVS